MSRPARKKLLSSRLAHQTRDARIAAELGEYEQVFTPYYGNRDFDFLKSIGALESSIGGRKLAQRCLDYLRDHRLPCEYGGMLGDFDLAVHCSDLVWPHNLDGKKVVLVQEGMTDPPSVLYPLVRRFRSLPGWLAGTSAFGLSDRYQRFCVASPGYADLLRARGCDPPRFLFTGIPHFDDWLRTAPTLPSRVVLCSPRTRANLLPWTPPFLEDAAGVARARAGAAVQLHPNERSIAPPRGGALGAGRALGRRGIGDGVANAQRVCNYSTLA